MSSFGATRALVRTVLGDALLRDGWTVQGFGMLRTYITPEIRILLWNSNLKFDPLPSEMHTHPWHLQSTIISGRLTNRRFVPAEDGQPFHKTRILCGEGGGPVGNLSEVVTLRASAPEVYLRGETYRQRSDEIHVSSPDDGCVTLCERTFLEDVDHADVFWPAGQEWVTAEPRPATTLEITDTVRFALERWDEP